MRYKLKTLIITGGRFNQEFAVLFLEQNKYDYIIAVDRGERYCRQIGLTPDMVIGDYDTRGTEGLSEYKTTKTQVIVLQPEKDDTDTEAAIQQAIKRGNSFDIIGAMGGRMDHFLGNIHNLKLALDKNIQARLINENNIIWLEKNNFTIDKNNCPLKYMSFMPFDGEVKGLTLKGFKYPLDGFNLKPGTSRCISNELVDQQGVIEFQQGCLIVLNTQDSYF